MRRWQGRDADEEMSRAKERVFSLRTRNHRWDPKNQRPELWHLYNTHIREGESMRVFPLSNWTELDVWNYIDRENIPVVPLYFAARRPVVHRSGTLIMVADEAHEARPGEQAEMKQVRFRTLGCYPLTGAIESDADSVPAIIREMVSATHSERQGRVIDHDGEGSMERKKQEGISDVRQPVLGGPRVPRLSERPANTATSCASSPVAAWTTASRR